MTPGVLFNDMCCDTNGLLGNFSFFFPTSFFFSLGEGRLKLNTQEDELELEELEDELEDELDNELNDELDEDDEDEDDEEDDDEDDTQQDRSKGGGCLTSRPSL